MTKPLPLIKDTREQYKPPFSKDVTVEVAKLDFGDYSAVGLTEIAALELKWSLDDLATCVGPERERFDTMLRGLARYPVRCIIVAATQDEVRDHVYVSAVRPQAIIASTWAWAQDYKIPTIWARDAAGATRTLEWWLRRAAEKRDALLPEQDRHELVAEITRAVREELRFELIASGVGQPPYHWADFDRLKLAERLRAFADEIDPPEEGGRLRTFADVEREEAAHG